MIQGADNHSESTQYETQMACAKGSINVNDATRGGNQDVHIFSSAEDNITEDSNKEGTTGTDKVVLNSSNEYQNKNSSGTDNNAALACRGGNVVPPKNYEDGARATQTENTRLS